MARGSAAFRAAKTSADYNEATQEFSMAILSAPWHAEAYFNQGLALDKAGHYDAALDSLRLALSAAPGNQEVKTLIYEVEYRKEKLGSGNSDNAGFAGRVEGRKYLCSSGEWLITLEISGGQIFRVSQHTRLGHSHRGAVGTIKGRRVEVADGQWCNLAVAGEGGCPATARFSMDGDLIEFPIRSSRSSRGNNTYDLLVNEIERCRRIS